MSGRKTGQGYEAISIFVDAPRSTVKRTVVKDKKFGHDKTIPGGEYYGERFINVYNFAIKKKIIIIVSILRSLPLKCLCDRLNVVLHTATRGHNRFYFSHFNCCHVHNACIYYV